MATIVRVVDANSLANEATSQLTADDWLVCQLDGETFLRKVGCDLIVPAASILNAHLAAEVKTLSASSFVSIPTLGANVSVSDTILIYDNSTSSLKRVTPAQLIPDGSLADAEISSGAAIDRSKLATYSDTKLDLSDKAVPTSYNTSSIYSHGLTFTIPRAGEYLIIAVCGGTMLANAGNIGIMYAQLRDMNGAVIVTDIKVCASDSTINATNVAGSATMMATCSVASAGSKTVRICAKITMVVGASYSGTNTKLTDSYATVISI